MSDSPEQAVRPTAAQPTGKYGAGILSILLLAGGFLLLFIPAMWMLAALKWADKPLLVAVALLTLAAVALLTLTGWCLARRRGWDDQKRHACLLGQSLLYCLAITLLEAFLIACCICGYCVCGFSARDVFWYNLSQCIRLLQFLLSAVSVYLLYRSFALLPGRLRTIRGRSEKVALTPSGGALPAKKRPVPDGPDQATWPAGKGGSWVISCLLLTAYALLLYVLPFYVLPLSISMSWEGAFQLLVIAMLLTLAGWWLARQRGYARQEEQARFHQLTLLCGLAIPLSQSFWPEIRLAGGGLGRVVDALLHLDMYALRLGIQALQLGIAVLVCVRLWRSIGDVLPRRPLSGCRDCGKVRLIAYLSFQLLVVGVLLGSIIYFFRFR